jgi:tRNA-2-methylthio-N6-dimethylallyladenosine synthase
MPYYYIWTIGCQMNKAESERLASYLEALGYECATAPDGADLIFLNSCVVRQSAENRVVNKLLSLRAIKKTRPQVKIALTGCLVESDGAELKRRFPFVDYFFPAGDFPAWLGKREPEKLIPLQPSVASYIPIMQGCNNFCAYCIVPYRRGREVSRPPGEILEEVRELVKRGTREVTLLGQNVDSYGRGLEEQTDLADLLEQLNGVPDLLRIRFLTNHPKDMQERLINAIARLDRVCEQINLPVQAGSDEILKAMRRGYTRAEYVDLVGRIRARIPEIGLTTDIIVGFPGESEAAFQDTLDLVSALRFDQVHVAAYSVRSGTLAAREMNDDVPAETKRERLARIETLQTGIATEINHTFLDRVVEILVEGQEKGKWFGRTRGDKLVFFPGTGEYRGKLVDIKITHTGPWSLSGAPVPGTLAHHH